MLLLFDTHACSCHIGYIAYLQIHACISYATGGREVSINVIVYGVKTIAAAK